MLRGVSKLKVLRFMLENEIVTPLMLCQEFGFKPKDAYSRLNKLTKAKLAESMRDPSYGYKKTWCLTEKGYKRFYYLRRKFEGT